MLFINDGFAKIIISVIYNKQIKVYIFLFNIAFLLFKTLDNMATLCSVNTIGKYLVASQLEVTICDLKFENSISVNSNIKSDGKRSRFHFTCCFKTFVSTPYSSAKFLSNITF